MTASAVRLPFVVKGWHVLVALLLFFGGDIAINAYFIATAYRTFPGETSITPYEDGMAYNASLRQLQDQEARGWRLTVQATPGGRLQVQALDRRGAPLRNVSVSVKLTRPATETGSATLSLRETAPGVYVGAASALHGAWDLDITAIDGQNHLARADRRVVLP